MFIKVYYNNYNMKAIKKIIIIGDSSGIIFDKLFMRKMKLKKGDFVKVDVKSVKL